MYRSDYLEDGSGAQRHNENVHPDLNSGASILRSPWSSTAARNMLRRPDRVLDGQNHASCDAAASAQVDKGGRPNFDRALLSVTSGGTVQF